MKRFGPKIEIIRNKMDRPKPDGKVEKSVALSMDLLSNNNQKKSAY
jgi:hypothetical protein